jgi:hypothetical protein
MPVQKSSYNLRQKAGETAAPYVAGTFSHPFFPSFSFEPFHQAIRPPLGNKIWYCEAEGQI